MFFFKTIYTIDTQILIQVVIYIFSTYHLHPTGTRSLSIEKCFDTCICQVHKLHTINTNYKIYQDRFCLHCALYFLFYRNAFSQSDLVFSLPSGHLLLIFLLKPSLRYHHSFSIRGPTIPIFYILHLLILRFLQV